MRLKGKIAVVTGGARGMGREAAVGMAREGASVAIGDLNEAEGAQTVADITAAGGRALFRKCDVTRAADTVALVAAAEAAWGPINIAMINAAVQLHGRDAMAHELSEEVWDATQLVNMKGMWLSCKATLPSMIKAGGGSMIIMGSPTGINGAGGFTAYASSKAGSHGLARTIAQDYAKYKIRCNILVPGPMDTPLNKPFFGVPEIRKAIEADVILGRLGEGHEIVGLAIFLASDESGYCTGGYYMADGGMTAW